MEQNFHFFVVTQNSLEAMSLQLCRLLSHGNWNTRCKTLSAATCVLSCFIFTYIFKASRSNSLLCSFIYAEIRQSCSCAGHEVEVQQHTFLFSALQMGDSGQFYVPVALPPGKASPVSIELQAGLAPELLWVCRRSEKFFVPGWSRTRTTRPSIPQFIHYTDYIILFSISAGISKQKYIYNCIISLMLK